MFDDLVIYKVDSFIEPSNLHELVNYALRNGVADGDLWHNYLTHLILSNENYFSLACERREAPKNSLSEYAKRDLIYFSELYRFAAHGNFQFDFSENTDNPICSLGKKIAQSVTNPDAVFNLVTWYYKNYGVGIFAQNKAFRLDDSGKIEAVANVGNINLNDILGYEIQKSELIANTEAFLNNKPANNVLLYGDGGTGKSSSIKALLNDYYGRGLRIIEIYRHQFKRIPELVKNLRTRNYYFIIFIDDLSFEHDESEYKYLKAVIEGGIETRPDNILIYATSNRRHLIREIWSDRDDMEHNGDVHRSDTLEEKLSLSSRFGIAINYSSPNREMYHEIVKELARRAGINFDEAELLKGADAWEIKHGGKTGRAARQYIDYLSGRN